MKPTTQTITLDGGIYGPRTMPASVAGGLGVARTSPLEWSVVHIGSGRIVHKTAQYGTKRDALAAMSRLLALDVPWGDPDPRVGALRAALEHNHRLILAAIKGE